MNGTASSPRYIRYYNENMYRSSSKSYASQHIYSYPSNSNPFSTSSSGFVFPSQSSYSSYMESSYSKYHSDSSSSSGSSGSSDSSNSPSSSSYQSNTNEESNPLLQSTYESFLAKNAFNSQSSQDNRRLVDALQLINYNRMFPLSYDQNEENKETLDEHYLIDKLEKKRLDSEIKEVKEIVEQGLKANLSPISVLQRYNRIAIVVRELK